MPRLTQFIRENIEEILVEWEAFARTLPMTESMDVVALRDHARAMLMVMASDLATAQTPKEQTDKAKGKSDADEAGPPTSAAQEHGAARAGSGLSMAQMLSELRALRASVIRLWLKQQTVCATTDLEDMTRFNEAIDQAIAESVTQYSEEIGESKERFLAILGHDLRNPLGAIMMSANFMLELKELGEPHRNLVTRIAGSARRMNAMVSDLLDFTRTRFGGAGIPIVRADMDLARMVQDVVSEVGARYPASAIHVATSGDLRGQWDCARLTQMLTNLVGNAVQHGAEKTPIAVAAHGTAREITITVRNEGPVIPEADLSQIFQPGAQSGKESAHADEHLGLGLFIVDRIIAAHGGIVEVKSTRETGTIFTVRLPRTIARRAAIPGRRSDEPAEAEAAEGNGASVTPAVAAWGRPALHESREQHATTTQRPPARRRK